MVGSRVWVRRGAIDYPPGTVGPLAANAEGVWLVSANHVLAGNGARLPADGVYVDGECMGRTVVFLPLERSGNRADAGACLLAPHQRPAWPDGWAPTAVPHVPQLRTRVKVFAAGQDRFGVVSHRGVFSVAMQAARLAGGLGQVEFCDCLLVRTPDPLFKRPGNSGSLVVTAADCRPVGLITGTSIEHGSDYVVVSPLAHVLHGLKLSNQILL